MHYLENILSWKTDKLHGYGWFHLIIIVINVCITIVFIRRYKNHNEKQVKMTVFYFGLFFFFLELYKHLFISVYLRLCLKKKSGNIYINLWVFIIQLRDFQSWLFPIV